MHRPQVGIGYRSMCRPRVTKLVKQPKVGIDTVRPATETAAPAVKIMHESFSAIQTLCKNIVLKNHSLRACHAANLNNNHSDGNESVHLGPIFDRGQNDPPTKHEP